VLLLLFVCRAMFFSGFGVFGFGLLGKGDSGVGQVGGSEEAEALKLQFFGPDELHVVGLFLQIGRSEHSLINWVMVIVLGVPRPQLVRAF
jgi:hypothetical protein